MVQKKIVILVLKQYILQSYSELPPRASVELANKLSHSVKTTEILNHLNTS